MLKISLGTNDRGVGTLLCLGAHCDDIEIGCGGTVLHLAEQNPEMRVLWVVFSSSPERAPEARASAECFLSKVRHKEILIKEFRASFFPFVGAQIKEFFEEIKAQISPDVVLTHTRHDLHQDHRLICEMTWNTFRDHMILEYEIPKYDADLGAPNFFVSLQPEDYNAKVEYLLKYFASQRDKHWFTRDTFMALMRLRGVECHAPNGYAEAFYCRKAVMGSALATAL